MNLRLDRARVIVAGGASGIGAACARTLAEEGARVTVFDRDARGERVPGASHFVQVDVTDERAVEAAFAALDHPVDGLVCCVGSSGPFGQPIYAVQAQAWDAVMAVNVKGPFLLCKHARACMASGSAVVLLASDSAFVAAPGMTAYCASKGALLMLARGLSLELQDDGIRVNCVCPSIVDTPMSRADLGLPDGFVGFDFPVIEASEVAAHVTYLLSPVAASVNGAALVVDHGYLARSALPA